MVMIVRMNVVLT